MLGDFRMIARRCMSFAFRASPLIYEQWPTRAYRKKTRALSN